MVELIDGMTPQFRIRMHDHAGHEDHAVLFEQIAVFEKGVVHDLSDRRAKSVVPEDFLESGAEDGTLGFQGCDVEAP